MNENAPNPEMDQNQIPPDPSDENTKYTWNADQKAWLTGDSYTVEEVAKFEEADRRHAATMKRVDDSRSDRQQDNVRSYIENVMPQLADAYQGKMADQEGNSGETGEVSDDVAPREPVTTSTIELPSVEPEAPALSDDPKPIDPNTRPNQVG